ncbi:MULTISPECIES: DUF4089 domain-containing protein [unclassified Beijerinckia]|uniref:DUF4089 domain-containing protein n=1 Tax=unclassified Beijerinckia TaxID=2638183 RepID=UPI00089B6292|nr:MULTISPECIES: DUF4089 domain-containing protein [unclassified Beijerinckia]MDH7799769.1 hypothetical protein [Beijerinckia sp. GAS462]SED36723.1 Protein of unknown function [Beijerinckia sp. 28-YEA-48]
MDDNIDWDAFIAASAKVMDITVSEASRPIVRANLEVAARMAKLVADFPLDEREEPAPVFGA